MKPASALLIFAVIVTFISAVFAEADTVGKIVPNDDLIVVFDPSNDTQVETTTFDSLGQKSEQNAEQDQNPLREGVIFTNATGDFVFDSETRTQSRISNCRDFHSFHTLMMQDCMNACPGSKQPPCKNIFRMRLLYCTCPRNKVNQDSCQPVSMLKVNDCDTRSTFSKNQCAKGCRMTGDGQAYVCTPKLSSGPFPYFCVCAK